MIKRIMKILTSIITVIILFSINVSASSSIGTSVIIKLKFSENALLESATIESVKNYQVLTPTRNKDNLTQMNLYTIEVLDSSKKVISSYSDNAFDYSNSSRDTWVSCNFKWSKNAKYAQVRLGSKVLSTKEIPDAIINNTKEATKSIPTTESNITIIGVFYNKSYTIKSSDKAVSFMLPSGTFKENVFIVIEKIKSSPKYDNGRINASYIYRIRAINSKGKNITKLEKDISITFKTGNNEKQIKSDTQQVTFSEDDLGKVQYLKSKISSNDVVVSNNKMGIYTLTAEEDKNIYIFGIDIRYVILTVLVLVLITAGILIRKYIIKKRNSQVVFTDTTGILS